MKRNLIENGLSVAAMGLLAVTLNATDGARPVDPIRRDIPATNRTAVLPQRDKLAFATGPQTKVK